jgi:hypothetical protein
MLLPEAEWWRFLHNSTTGMVCKSSAVLEYRISYLRIAYEIEFTVVTDSTVERID